MKYKVQKGCVIDLVARQPGEIVEIADHTAKMLMGIGRIVPVHEEEETTNRSVGLDEESKPRRRGRKAKG